MITIVGPTASGKTSVATQLAYRLSSEVISADSRQVYRDMDLGTGKDLTEYQVEGKPIPYHLIDIMPAGSRYNLFAFQRDFHKVYQDMLARGITSPILCGGTGMYVEAILRGYQLAEAPPNEDLRSSLTGKSLNELKVLLAQYDPLHNRSDVDSAQRAIRAIEIAEYRVQQASQGETCEAYPPIPSLVICLDLPREERRERISQRLRERLDAGMIREVESLLASGIHPENLIYYGLEYKWLTLYVTKQIPYAQMVQELETAIHQFAKRQMTWFRGMERRGHTLHYIDALLPMEQKLEQVLDLYADWQQMGI